MLQLGHNGLIHHFGLTVRLRVFYRIGYMLFAQSFVILDQFFVDKLSFVVNYHGFGEPKAMYDLSHEPLDLLGSGGS